MAILLDELTRLCVVGATGGRARADLELNVGYGTRIVAGVAPGRAGETIAGVPVFDSCADAAAAAPFDAVVAYLPPRAYVAAMADVLAQRPKWVHVVTEGIPLHDNVAVLASARAAGVRLIGPNTNGIISPGRAKAGFLGHAHWLLERGGIGVLSRSGGYIHDLAYVLRLGGYGVSTAIGIGGDAVAGQGFADLLDLFEEDDETKATLLYTEAGPDIEQEVADGLRSGRFTKPIVALVSGEYLDDFPTGRVLGHAGAFLSGPSTRAVAKREALQRAGAAVVQRSDEIPAALRRLLGAAASPGN